MRDAQNILDQVIAYSDGYLSVQKTLEVLGRTDFKIQKEFICALWEGKLKTTGRLINEIFMQGKNMPFFLYELIHLFSSLVY